jgi:His-Xaa-Ser system radical SAM maturase HxsC
MLNFSRGVPNNINKQILGKIKTVNICNEEDSCIVVLKDDSCITKADNGVIAAIILKDFTGLFPDWLAKLPSISQVPNTICLNNDDIVQITPRGRLRVLFRASSIHNALFITGQCNSKCLMCPQPPITRNDINEQIELNREIIELMPKYTRVLGVTGGEPTLAGLELVDFIAYTLEALPEVELNILTNGRAFVNQELAKLIATTCQERGRFSITIHSDYYAQHDFAEQVSGAFNQTMAGLYNLARYSARIEIRIVLHKISVPRLHQIADYIFRNLPFAENIAFMGLENTGYARFNFSGIWINPLDYAEKLQLALELLDQFGMPVSIYNLPFCLLPSSMWKFARNSISTWKQTFLNECQICCKYSECGGVFISSFKQLSNHLKPIAL